MVEVELACLRKRPVSIGRGLYRETFRIGKYAIKVEKLKKDFSKTCTRAREIYQYNQRIREKVDFLPAFYGTVLTAKKVDKSWVPVVVSFYEFVPPARLKSLKDLKQFLELINKAAKAGYVLDIKPSNFGRRRDKIYYLDEYGLGKGPIPPDVYEEFLETLKPLLMLKERAGRSRARQSG